MNFNFGPIARTDAGGTHDTINLASFPLHVILNALVGSTSVEEFIAWLWHDLYKPAFQWVKTGRGFSWYHIPGLGAFETAEAKFAHLTGVRCGLVSSHQPSKDRKTKQPIPRKDPLTGISLPMVQILEEHFLSDQGDQVNLGAAVNYIQLSIFSEPAMPTVLVRSVLANAFIEVVTKSVAAQLRQAFIDDHRTPIEQVKFEFNTVFPADLSQTPDDNEIWNKLGQKFDVQPGNVFLMRHFTPVTSQGHQESFATNFTADLTGNPLMPERMLNNVVSLAELLTLYQDSRTIIMAVPQTQLYTLDPAAIKRLTLDATREQLDNLSVLTFENNIDYLDVAFDTQVDIREIPGRQAQRSGTGRPLVDVILHPAKRLSEIRESPDCRICRLSGTPFITNLNAAESRLDKLFSSSFVDTEFVGIDGDIAPLTYLYVLNSPNAGGAGRAGVPKRTSLRGAFALLAPATQVAVTDQTVKAVEVPPLDQGGRFNESLNRITVTTQEFTLFQQMSRRVLSQLWQSISPDEPLPLPYLGAILLTHESRQTIRNLLPQLDTLLADVTLRAYPFDVGVQPAIEVALEAAIHDSKHASKHTVLKIAPRTVMVGSKASIPILTDDNVQTDINRALFNRVEELTRITGRLMRKKRKMNQKELWLKLILTGDDPVTAVMESAQAATDMRKSRTDMSLDSIAFNDAQRFWDEFIDNGDISKSWDQYEELNQITAASLDEFPTLSTLLQAFQKSETEGGSSEPTK